MDDPAAVLCASAPASSSCGGGSGGSRRMFSMELRPGEITTVSRKKLLKGAGLGAALPPPLPAAAAQPLAGPVAGPSGAVCEAGLKNQVIGNVNLVLGQLDQCIA